MGYDAADVYYQPEKFDLEPVFEIDYSDGCYQFDLRVVWRHADGRLFTARDSGCSCPSPFEDYTSLDQLDDFDLEALKAEITENVGDEDKRRWGELSQEQADEAIQKLERLTR